MLFLIQSKEGSSVSDLFEIESIVYLYYFL